MISTTGPPLSRARRRIGLVCPVLARRPAQLALIAFVLIDVGQAVIVEIELFHFVTRSNRPAAHVGQGSMTAVIHPVREPVDQVLDDAEAVMHDRGTDLQRARPQRDEFGGITPIGDPADAGDGIFTVDLRPPRTTRWSAMA